MTRDFDERLLESPGAIEQADPSGLLRAVATCGAQVRSAQRLAEEAGVRRVADDGRPRAVLVAGLGASAVCAQVVAATCGAGAPVPVLPVLGFALPGWVGPMDLVAAVSGTGATEETLAITDEAIRRGCRLVTVSPPDSPLAAASLQGRGLHVQVDDDDRPPRMNLWAQTVPLLLLADALGLAATPGSVLDRVADRLDALAVRCAPGADSYENPAKQLALELADSVPVVWGSSDLAGAAAYRFGSQLMENAKLPAVTGTLPGAGHDQIALLDSPMAEEPDASDFFRDRVEESGGARLRLVLLRDNAEDRRVTQRCAAIQAIAEERGVAISELHGTGEHPVERLAELVAVTDFASVYLAVGYGLDPASITPIAELKERIRR
jgi:glucose/mannose-6-phosphate isomerase